MKYLHTMIRVSDPDATIAFFNLLGLEEVRRMIEVASRRPRNQALVMTLYGAGLRISEALALKAQDIPSSYRPAKK